MCSGWLPAIGVAPLSTHVLLPGRSHLIGPARQCLRHVGTTRFLHCAAPLPTSVHSLRRGRLTGWSVHPEISHKKVRHPTAHWALGALWLLVSGRFSSPDCVHPVVAVAIGGSEKGCSSDEIATSAIIIHAQTCFKGYACLSCPKWSHPSQLCAGYCWGQDRVGMCGQTIAVAFGV